ncbi:MAG: hypothetical protein ACRD8Z_06880, partial [Nitrososphaeraceae archaeon]
MYGKPINFVVILSFVVALVYSQSAIPDVFAVMKSPRFGGADAKCFDNPQSLTVSCCWEEIRHTGAEGSHGFETVTVCQSCDIDLTTGDISDTDCGPVGRTSGGSVFDTPGNLPNGTNVPKGGIFQPQPAPPNSTVPSGGIFEEQPTLPSGPAIPGGGTFESGGTFNSLQPTQEGAPPPTEEGT